MRILGLPFALLVTLLVATWITLPLNGLNPADDEAADITIDNAIEAATRRSRQRTPL